MHVSYNEWILVNASYKPTVYKIGPCTRIREKKKRKTFQTCLPFFQRRRQSFGIFLVSNIRKVVGKLRFV